MTIEDIKKYLDRHNKDIEIQCINFIMEFEGDILDEYFISYLDKKSGDIKTKQNIKIDVKLSKDCVISEGTNC